MGRWIQDRFTQANHILKSDAMNKILLIAAFSLFFIGCNMNPSKEARIQKLETEVQQSTEKIKTLENRIQTLEARNAELTTRILELEMDNK